MGAILGRMNSDYQAVLDSVAASPLTGFELRQHAMAELDKLAGFDWSGIYRLEGDMLVLDAYVGAATDHDRIPVGRGVCGTAVAENRSQVISDVRELDNYLSCSAFTRSEIVVLIREGEKILGQIDIDGHDVGRFGEEEERFLDALGQLLAKVW
jgi:GAF domain-containing protein